MKERLKIALVLSLLSPVFGELISGSSPPLEFVNPLSFLFLWGLYGGGVLIIRELWVRWGKGYMRLMLMGIAYGIMEEGLAIKSFFDPNWMDLGILGTYGRIAGVNTVWVVWLSIFHAIYSISVPILLIDILYPEYVEKRLLMLKGLFRVFVVFVFTCFVIFSLMNPYVPPLLPYTGAFLSVVLILWWSGEHQLKRRLAIKGFERHSAIWGAIFGFSLFVDFAILPKSGIHPIIPCAVGILLTYSLFSSMSGLNRRKLMGALIGILSPFLLFFDVLLELNGIPGMSLVGLGAFIILFTIFRKIGIRSRVGQG